MAVEHIRGKPMTFQERVDAIERRRESLHRQYPYAADKAVDKVAGHLVELGERHKTGRLGTDAYWSMTANWLSLVQESDRVGAALRESLRADPRLPGYNTNHIRESGKSIAMLFNSDESAGANRRLPLSDKLLPDGKATENFGRMPVNWPTR